MFPNSRGFSWTIGIPLSHSEVFLLAFLTILSPFCVSAAPGKVLFYAEPGTEVSTCHWRENSAALISTSLLQERDAVCCSFCICWEPLTAAEKNSVQLQRSVLENWSYIHTRTETQTVIHIKTQKQLSGERWKLVRLWAWCPAELWPELQLEICLTHSHIHTHSQRYVLLQALQSCRHAHCLLPFSLLPSQSFQELLRLAGLKGKVGPSPEMSRFCIRWLNRFMIRQDASPPSRRNSWRDIEAGCWSHTLRDPPRCTCKAPLHALIDSKPQEPKEGMRSNFFAKMFWATQNQSFHMETSAWAAKQSSLVSTPLQSHIGNSRKQLWCKAGRSRKSWVTVCTTSVTKSVHAGGENESNSALHKHKLILWFMRTSSQLSEGLERGWVNRGRSRGQPVEHKSPSAAWANYIPPLLN